MATNYYRPTVPPPPVYRSVLEEPRSAPNPNDRQPTSLAPAPVSESNGYNYGYGRHSHGFIGKGNSKGNKCKGKGCGPCWFGYAGGLYMTRDRGNHTMFSYFDTASENQLLDTRDASMDWSGGYEIRLGRTFCDCAFALELGYWELDPGSTEINLYAPAAGSLNSTYDFGRLQYNDGTNPQAAVNNWYDDSQRHRLRRTFEIRSAELNFLSGGGYGMCCANPSSGLQLSWGVGIRFFQFNEGLQFATSHDYAQFGVTPTGEMFYDIDVDNQLYGGQIGFRAEWTVSDRLSFHAGTKFGVYNNHIKHWSRIGGHNGAAVVVGGPNDGMVYDVRSSKDDIAFLGEFDLGMGYRFTQHWRLRAGYRLVGISGIALAPNQIPYNFAGIQDVVNVDSNGSMLIHGGYAGLEFMW